MIRRGETARLRKVIKAKSIDDIAKVAKPWEPITDEYLSTKELLLLMGIDPRVKYHQYRRYLHFCTIAAHPGGNPDSLPHDLRTCFADRPSRSRPSGAGTIRRAQKSSIAWPLPISGKTTN